MKTSVISDDFRKRYLSKSGDPEAFEGRAIVFDGSEDYHRRIDDPTLEVTAQDILVIRGCGPIGFPGAAEVVNMRPPDYLIAQGVLELPCIGDGRQSGTSGSPSILHVTPEAAAGGDIALLRTGDCLRVDLRRNRLDVLLPDQVIRGRRAELINAGGYHYPASQTPWQEIQRRTVGSLADGALLEGAERFQRIDQREGIPRDSH